MKRRVAVGRGDPAPMVSTINERWSLDFVYDSLETGRRIRTLNIVDDYTRECLAIEVDTSLCGRRVARVLDAMGAVRGYPRTIVMDKRDRTHEHCDGVLGARSKGSAAFHSTRKAHAKRLHREFQWPLSRRMPQRARIRDIGSSSVDHRI
jgi:transposase InsO family protein